MDNTNIYYNLGKKDMLAEILMNFRLDEDFDKTILMLSNLFPDNPHAQHFIKKFEVLQKPTTR